MAVGREIEMTYWRTPRVEPKVSDWTVFWLVIGLAVAIAGIGWVTA